MASLAGALLLLVVLFIFLMRPAPEETSGQIQGQIAALQQNHHADIDALKEAPYYQIEAVIEPESGQFAGRMVVNYTNTGEEQLDTVVFRLYPNARSIYGGGKLVVTAARQGSTLLQAEPSQDPTILTFPLSRSLSPGESTVLDLEFSGQAPLRGGQGYGIFARQPDSLALAGWYPVLASYDDGWLTPEVPLVGDAMQADTSFYAAALTLPSEYQLASSGTVISTGTLTTTLPFQLTETPAGAAQSMQDDTGWVTWQVVSGPVRELALAAGAKYQIATSEVNDISLRMFHQPSNEAGLGPRQGLAIAANILNEYEELFGPYPFNELDIVENPITVDGYEFSGMIYLHPDLRSRASQSSYESILAHEIAHQWWYGLAGNQPVTEPWLDEAHASYSEVLYLEQTGRSEGASALIKSWEEYLEENASLKPVNSPALDFSSWDLYADTVYIRGLLFIHALRQEMGDERFFRFLRRYQEEVRYGSGNTELYLRLAEEVAGRQLDDFFQPWISRDH